MGIRQTTTAKEIDRYIEQRIERIISALIYNLKSIGEQCINAARDSNKSNDYTDQTGNLRSSIGYLIVADGKIIYQSSFEVVKNGNEGQKSGIQYAKSLARQFPEGIVLIVAAGMKYASYVSAKGRDVLDSSELIVDKLVPKILKQLGFNK